MSLQQVGLNSENLKVSEEQVFGLMWQWVLVAARMVLPAASKRIATTSVNFPAARNLSLQQVHLLLIIIRVGTFAQACT